jgi:glycosyltransferase involved in cell wall biosynthesis
MMAERVRVLRIIARLNIGGPAIHATLLTERLDPARYDSRLLAGTEGEDEGSYLDLQRRPVPGLVRVPELGRAIRGGQDFTAFRTLSRLMREFRPHIVHTHTAKAGTLGRLAAWLRGVPIVVHTYHGHVLQGYFGPAATRAIVATERFLARRSSCLVTVSEQVRREILERGIGRPDRFVVVPLGFDLARFAHAETRRGELRRELGLPADAPLVGIVARLVPIKAHELFIDAAAQVAAAHPGATFIIVGDGERRQELEALVARRGLTARTRFLGWRGDLDRIYADLDVVALTSRNEGSPVALIEAMAAARPVVSTAVGGVADVVTHDVTGLLAPRDDARAVGEAVSRLLMDAPLAARLGAAARARVLPLYDGDRLLRDIDDLYSQLIARELPGLPWSARVRETPASGHQRPLPDAGAQVADARAASAGRRVERAGAASGETEAAS